MTAKLLFLDAGCKQLLLNFPGFCEDYYTFTCFQVVIQALVQARDTVFSYGTSFSSTTALSKNSKQQQHTSL